MPYAEQLRELEGQTPLTDAVLAQIPSTMDTQLDADFMNIMVRHARDLERALTAAKAELAAIREVALKDPVVRMNNLCKALEEQMADSPYSAESWELADAKNKQLRESLKKAEAELATKSEDAARYRWLREAGKTGGQEGGVTQRGVTIVNGDKVVLHFVYWTTKEGFDAAIDAARGKP